MADKNKQTGAFLRRNASEGAFVKKVAAVSLAVALLLLGLGAMAWQNRDSLYSSYASMQAGRGDYSAAVKTADGITEEAVKLQTQYNIAQKMYEKGAYAEGTALFDTLGDYADSKEMRMLCAYAQADALYQTGQYEEALAAFAALGGYSDSVTRQQQTIYAMAEEAQAEGDLAAAMGLYLSVADYGDGYDKALAAALALTGDEETAKAMLESGGQTPESLEKILHISERRNLLPGMALDAGAYHTVVLYPDGTVDAWGDDTYGQCQVDSWRNIVQVSAGAYHTVGLKADGTLVATGNNDQGQCNVEGLTGIVQIAAGDRDTYALSSAGQVAMRGCHSYESILNAVDVTEIYAGSYSAVAATGSGTFVASHKSGAMKPGSQVLHVGLNTGYSATQYLDGTLVSTTDLGGEWKDTVSFDAGPTAVVAVDLEGKVRAHFFREADAVDFSGLEGIVWCAAGTEHFAFLTEAGELLVLGGNSRGQCDVGSQRQMD